ncbi:MAG: hypothetical protein SXG53_02765 [Pseudomonadota bacterium]|nr:hypothetical protein [Pseudomonadota bacterium]
MLDFEDDIVIHMPTSVQMTSPEAARTLEEARLRRRAELADWQPSGGWLTEQRNVRHHVRAGAR